MKTQTKEQLIKQIKEKKPYFKKTGLKNMSKKELEDLKKVFKI